MPRDGKHDSLRNASRMRQLFRALRGRSRAWIVREMSAAFMGTLRFACGKKCGLEERFGLAPPDHVALPGTVAGPRRREHRVAGRNDDPCRSDAAPGR